MGQPALGRRALLRLAPPLRSIATACASPPHTEAFYSRPPLGWPRFSCVTARGCCCGASPVRPQHRRRGSGRARSSRPTPCPTPHPRGRTAAWAAAEIAPRGRRLRSRGCVPATTHSECRRGHKGAPAGRAARTVSWRDGSRVAATETADRRGLGRVLGLGGRRDGADTDGAEPRGGGPVHPEHAHRSRLVFLDATTVLSLGVSKGPEVMVGVCGPARSPRRSGVLPWLSFSAPFLSTSPG